MRRWGLSIASVALVSSAFSCSSEDPADQSATGGSGMVTSGGASQGSGGASTGAGGTGDLASGGASLNSGGSVGAGGVGGSGVGGTSPEGIGGVAPEGAGGDGSGGAIGTGGAGPEVTVQLGDVRQLIRGFGINNNWSPAMDDSLADTLFKNGEGQLGLNILRIGMGPTGDAYNGADAWNDVMKADERGAEYIIATLWSPPGNMKINEDGSPHSTGESNGNGLWDGGHLDPAYYEEWSDTIAAFPAKVKAATGVDLHAMSPQNETDFASCGFQEPCNGNYDTTVMTGAEAAAFQKIVGPKLRAAGVIPMSVEASEWLHVWSNESPSGSVPSGLDSSDPLGCGFPPTNCPHGAPFDDGYEYGYALYGDGGNAESAWGDFDIMGTHQYDTHVAEPWPADVERGDKEVWQTEMSGVKWWPEQGDIVQDGSANGGWKVTGTGHIENGVAVARWVHSGLVVGEANAWLWWWWKAINDDTDDNEGLVLRDNSKAKRFYTFGNFTKYVRPGYHRVGMTGDVPDKVLLSAYQGPDETVVVVAINETTAAVEIPITIGGEAAPQTMTPVVTSQTDSLATKDNVVVVNGIFQAALPAMSVTTFVGN